MAEDLDSARKLLDVCATPITNTTELEDAVEIEDSYGYCCSKPQNLSILGNALLYSSGTVLHILDLDTGDVTLRQCSSAARSIGHVTTNHVDNHIAVGEVGENPSIFIYRWPNFDVVAKLDNGTERSYVCLDYSADRTMLCSQGGEPDNSLSVWEWGTGTLLITFKPSEQAIYRVMFSRIQSDTIITCGRGHIGFWCTVKTFTGMKITGESGKFGATEVTDILNVECLPGGKVASGCSWGNILVWSNDRVEYEIAPKRGVCSCHTASVAAFHCLPNNRLVSIGSDGWVRLWDMDAAHLEEKEGRTFSFQEAILYFRIARGASFISKVTTVNQENETWYLQDYNGAIWKAEVGPALRGEVSQPRVTKILRSHGGSVAAISASPHDTRVASLGSNGRLIIREYTQKICRSVVLERECYLPGSALFWLPPQVDASGNKLIAGFGNGVIAMYSCATLRELQAMRPHNGPVTTITAVANESYALLASAGQDGTVFIADVLRNQDFRLKPRGLLSIRSEGTSLQWNINQKIASLLVCYTGGYSEYELSVVPPKMQSPLSLSMQPQKVVHLSDHLGEPFNSEDSRVILGRYMASGGVMLITTCSSASCICEVNESGAISSFSLPMPEDARVTCAVFTPNCSLAILGFDSGAVQVSLRSGGTTPWQHFWRHSMHENGSHVMSLALSFDLSNFFSTGHDGNEFKYRISQHIIGESPEMSPVVTQSPQMVEKRIGRPARNLTLTMEQVEQLKISRKSQRDVKNKKISIMKRLEKLKENYKEFISRDDISAELLPKCSEALHPLLAAQLEKEIAELRSSMLSDVKEKARKTEDTWHRVYQFFLEPLQSDSLRVYTFSEDLFVECYRLKKIKESEMQEYEKLKLDLESDIKIRHFEKDGGEPGVCSATSSFEGSLQVTPEPVADTQDMPAPSLVLERYRRNREQRRIRLEQIEELETQKPERGVYVMSAEDELKISEAERTIGDYRLKCDAEFPAPPDLRVSPLRTKVQLAQTKLEIHKLKEEFNKEIFVLIARKDKLISSWKRKLIENPDLLFLRETLKLREEESGENDLLKLCGGKGSDWGVTYSDEHYTTLTSVKDFENEMSAYDEAVMDQISRRAELDTRVTMLKLRALSLQREELVLQEFVPTENDLFRELEQAKDKRSDLEHQLDVVSEQIKDQKKRIVDLRKAERATEKRLFAEAGGTKYYENLLALLKSQPVSKDSSLSGSSVDSETGTGNTTPSRRRRSGSSCPAGCDPALFTLMSELRLERAEIHNQKEEIDNELLTERKEEEILLKKINLINNSIKYINQKIEKFQRERQARLDAIEEVVPLKLHQIPADVRLADCVVIPKEELTRLEGRAQELRNDTSQLQQLLAEDKKYLQTLTQKTAETNLRINSLKSNIEETMMKRFGKLVQMEELEAAVLSSDVDSSHLHRIDEDKKAYLSRLERHVAELTASRNKLAQEKADKMKYLATLLKTKNDLSMIKASKHENCSHINKSELELSVQKLKEIYRSEKEQVEALRHELGMLRCKMTSSRDLFPAVAAYAGPVEESEAATEDAGSRGRASSAGSIVAPEIYIQHCPDIDDEEESQTTNCELMSSLHDYND